MNVVYRTGWGRNLGANVCVLDISNFEQRSSYVKNGSGLAIGLGRSYGDSSLNSSGLSWSSESLSSIVIDQHQMVAFCGAGVTIGDLERAAIKYGLFPKVVPGTEFVTIGGAIASNIHGKSHQRFGSFGDQLSEITLIDADGITHHLTPQGVTKEQFWATVGGLGLTGAIVSAKVSLMAVQTAFVKIDEIRVHSLVQLLDALQDFDRKYLYTVAWIDLSGDFKGRGVVSGANAAAIGEVPKKFRSNPLVMKKPRNVSLPDIFPSRFINRLTVRIFNLLWFYKPLKRGSVNLQPYLHPLDSIKDWNRIYGDKGFIQYQISVPFGKEDFLHNLLKELREIGGVSFLGVVKRFGESDPTFLSFAKMGWTISLDISASNNKLLLALDRLDEQLVKIGGRVYLTKDSRLSKSNFEAMYSQHKDWLRIKKRMDSRNFWQSEQGKRLGLC